jgi:hypothetical protein
MLDSVSLPSWSTQYNKNEQSNEEKHDDEQVDGRRSLDNDE